MKQLFKVFTIAVIICSQYYSQSQYQIDLSGGISFPTAPSNFSNNWNSGINLNTSLGIKIKSNISAFINFEYYSYEYDGMNVEDLSNLKNNCTVLSVYPTLNFTLSNENSVIVPYTYFGIGWFNYSTDNSPYISDDESKSQLIMLIGLGAEYKLNNLIKIFLETDYRYGSIDNYRLEFIPIKLGLSLVL